MSEITKPIALDESLHTTEQTPRNLADVLSDELQNLATAISGGSDKVPKTDIATVEPTNIASRAYSVGELVYVNGNLYKVSIAITSGATFTVGTNIQSTNVGGAIKELNTVDSEVVDNNVFCYRTNHFVNISVQYYAISQASNVPSKYRPQSQSSVIGWNYSDNQACVFTVQTSGNIYVTDLSNTPLAGTKRVYATICYIV